MLMMEAKSISDIVAMPSPRVLNTHLPLKMFPQQLKQKKNKIVVVLRNPKDIVVSMYHHARGYKLYQFSGTFEYMLEKVVEGKRNF